jgi:hypothetical protein
MQYILNFLSFVSYSTIFSNGKIVNVTGIRNKQIFVAVTWCKHVFLSNLGRITRYFEINFALFVSTDDTGVPRINKEKNSSLLAILHRMNWKYQ